MRQRIVDGALLALARRGQHKFSMTDICNEASVSRGTLYRYFASKDDVLAAIEERLETRLRERVTTAIAEQPDVVDRIQVIAAAVVAHRDEFPALELLSRTEPGLVLARLADRFDDLAAFFQECLHPVLAEADQVRQGATTEELIARAVVHCGISAATLPSSRSGTAQDLATALEGLLGVRREAKRRRGARLAG
jgi:AcrR family transcriptional regulator